MGRSKIFVGPGLVPTGFRGLGVLVLLGKSSSASAEEWEREWMPQAGCAEVGVDSQYRVEVGGRGWYRPGYVPPFRSAERDRLSLGAQACFGIGPAVQLAGSWDWLRDVSAAQAAQGPGDVRLGTSVRVWGLEKPKVRLDVGLGWAVKLPDAEDEEGLGTDETDVDIGTWGRLESGPWSLQLGIALGIWGNPLRFANQDDLVLLAVDGRWAHGRMALGPSVSVAPESDRNPARIETDFFLEMGSGWFVRGQGGVGWTPAAPDWQAGLVLGWRGGWGKYKHDE